jgi:hypothetical protein
MKPLVGRTRVVLLPALSLLLLPPGFFEPHHGCCRFTDTKMVIKNLESALVHFQTEHIESCPPSIEFFVQEKYLTKPPRDAWGQELQFICPGAHNPDGADIISAGRDGEFRTADDIQSWEL